VRKTLLAIVATAVLASASLAAPAQGTTPALIDPLLQDALAAAGPTDILTAAVVFHSAPTALDLSALDATGVASAHFAQLDMAGVQGTAAQLEAVALLSTVKSMWLDRALDLSLAESVPFIQADRVYEPPLGFTGRGVRVAVIDSGIDGTHAGVPYPSKTVQNVKFVGFEDLAVPLEDVANTDTTSGHGSHVAGIVAGTGATGDLLFPQSPYVGVAPDAELVGLGAAELVRVLTALAAYNWILEHRVEYGIRVINNSWADGTIPYDDPADPQYPLNLASKAAHDAGITVVFAAGNDGQTADVFNRYAAVPWVISVGGGDKLGRLGDYSSRGNATYHADLIAPGSFIASVRTATNQNPNSTTFIDATNPAEPVIMPVQYQPYYGYKVGTSMAAPHVAGVVALMLEANPALTPDQVRALIASTATAMPDCPSIDCGAGYLNAFAAVEAALGAVNEAPVAALAASPVSGAAPLEVVLDASGSSDADGTVAAYRWDFDGDGQVDLAGSSAAATYTYEAGTWHAAVVVVDDDGQFSAPATVEVRASDPPSAVAVVPRHAKAETVVTFDGSGSTDPNDDIVAWEWDLDGDGTFETSGAVVTKTFPNGLPMNYPWAFRVTDAAGVAEVTGGTIKVTPSANPKG